MEVDEKPKPTFQSCITKPVFEESSTKPSQPVNSCFSDAVPKKDDSENNEYDDYLDSFPPGYRFCPRDEELIIHYLKKKVMNEPLPYNRITEVNLYRHNPETLAEQNMQYGEKEWYFFTPRDKKYRNGTRPNRAAGDGYWKATGADREIKFKDHIVGYRKALVFYRGKPPKGDKTNWIMHEYRVNDPPPCNTLYNDMRLDDWVLCRIYKKVDKSVGSRVKDNSRSQLIHKEETKAMDLDYNNADSIEYSNNIGGYMQQSFSDESFYNYGDDQFSTLLYGTVGIQPKIDSYHFIPGQDDIWSAEKVDFSSQPLDFNGGNVEPPIILDNILRDDTPKKDPTNSGGIEEEWSEE